MIARRLFPGGTTIDATATEHVAMIWDQHLDTSHGIRTMPFGQNLLDVSLADDGRRFAGKGHDGPIKDQAVEWTGVDYRIDGPAHGSRACLYDATGALVVATYDPSEDGIGVEGYRYVNDAGTIVRGRDSLAKGVNGRGIWEFVEHGDIVLGQGGKGPHGEDPVIAIYAGARRVLFPGKNYNVKFRKYGDLLVIAWWAVDDKSAALLRMNVADLAGYPEQRFDPIVIVPPPPPPPPPPKKDEAVPVPNRIDVVRAVLRDLVNVDPSAEVERGQITDEVVRRLNAQPMPPGIERWGRKDRDRDPNTTNNSDDALCALQTADRRFQIIDILVGLERGNEREKFADWAERGTFADGENGYFREVSGAPVDKVDPPLPTSTGDGITAAVRALIAAETKTLRASVAELQAEAAGLKALIAALEARPAGGSQDSLDGARIALQSNRGRFLRDDWADNVAKFDREDAGDGETFTVRTR